MKWISLILMAVGIAFLSYPKLQNYYVTYQQEKVINQFEERDLPQFPSYSVESLNTMNGVLEKGPTLSQTEASLDHSNSPEVPDNVLGILEIQRINVKIPIFQGATKEHLDYGIGQLVGSAQIGGSGNVALAAHRGYTYGRLFNRLDELQAGDELVATTKIGTYRYRVVKSFLVLPNNLSVLESNDNESLLTLITCHPVKDPTHRLIVQAVLEQ